MTELGAFAFLLAFIFLVVLFILWIILPFLIMGTNRRLDKLIDLMKKTNE